MEFITSKLTNILMKRRDVTSRKLTDFTRLSYEIRPCDVLLIAGRSRVSDVISQITQSRWTHAALYIGRLHDIENDDMKARVAANYHGGPSDQLVIESVMGKGTVVTNIQYYKEDHIRICRPTGISPRDAQEVINFCIKRIGADYDVRQILDLARFLFPWSLWPRRWRSTLFKFNPGAMTKQSCASLLGEAFLSIDFPILPVMKHTKDHHIELYQRIPRLFTPSDFDYSPYFEIIKYPVFDIDARSIYRNLPWNKEHKYADTEGKLYTIEELSEKKK